MNKITNSFKKLLGNGRAWLLIDDFTSEFMEVLISPLKEVSDKISKLKYVHFPTLNLDENNIKNSEELFNIDGADIQNKTLDKRAEIVESQWRLFSGSHTFEQLENMLKSKGFNVKIIENIPNILDAECSVFGNSLLHIENGNYDPAKYRNGKHTFFVEIKDFNNIEILLDNIVKIKSAHKVFILLYKFSI